ncbi:hypothetical protein KIN20_009807 [Parelaphostrongylus tenuis]|uniref:Uncharacterized protein n=1 Tax=Parelaphostrongylus tenuis TaxID=148309 RepID=A0AAD5QLH5_PARTN|nr:hypothetical protein KIN20_009807 [Parelaphostrongylus tenuis]
MVEVSSLRLPVRIHAIIADPVNDNEDKFVRLIRGRDVSGHALRTPQRLIRLIPVKYNLRKELVEHTQQANWPIVTNIPSGNLFMENDCAQRPPLVWNFFPSEGRMPYV